MTNKALQPIEQKTVIFYDDEITAVVVDVDGEQVVYVPLRPICEYLGVTWQGQLQRIKRDPVLSEVASSVNVTFTQGLRSQEVICLPLRYLNGWLFGINANRIKEEFRERLIRYQKECYEVLAQAFQSPAARPDTSATLMQVYEMGKAIMQMAQEQMEFDRRLAITEGRVDQAAVVVGDLRKRVTAIEQTLAGGRVVTDEQASQISQAVKAIALALGKKSGRNEFGAVYGELFRRFGITSYKLLPSRRFTEAMAFLTEWYEQVTGETSF